MSATDEDGRPALRDLVDVLLDSATEPVVATVTRVGDDGVLLDAPLDHARRIVLPAPGEGGLMVWRGARDMQQAPMTVLAVQRPPSPSWTVRLVGPGVRCQRRSFVRAEVLVPVVLSHGEDVFEVTAVDLSEGGMRCRTRDPLPLMSGEPVVAAFVMDGADAAWPARLVRLRHGDARQATDVGLAFTGMSITEADRMRRFVFDQLRRQRANASA